MTTSVPQLSHAMLWELLIGSFSTQEVKLPSHSHPFLCVLKKIFERQKRRAKPQKHHNPERSSLMHKISWINSAASSSQAGSSGHTSKWWGLFHLIYFHNFSFKKKGHSSQKALMTSGSPNSHKWQSRTETRITISVLLTEKKMRERKTARSWRYPTFAKGKVKDFFVLIVIHFKKWPQPGKSMKDKLKIQNGEPETLERHQPDWIKHKITKRLQYTDNSNFKL